MTSPATNILVSHFARTSESSSAPVTTIMRPRTIDKLRDVSDFDGPRGPVKLIEVGDRESKGEKRQTDILKAISILFTFTKQ